MSHKATNWLASLSAADLGNSEFRVLFHLCDCHNPSNGCFPTQAYLLDACAISNGTLNNALNSLEAKGFIRRHRERDGRTRRQKPTRYILGFEMGCESDPSPKTGDGSGSKPSPKTGGGRKANPSPKTGGGPVSKKGGKPSPKKGATRLQPTGEVTCKEPVNNQSSDGEALFFTDDERHLAREVFEFIKGGGSVVPEQIGQRIRKCIFALGLMTEAEMLEAEIGMEGLEDGR